MKSIPLYTLGLTQVKPLLALIGWASQVHNLPNTVATIHFHTLSATDRLFLVMFCTSYDYRRTMFPKNKHTLSVLYQTTLCNYLICAKVRMLQSLLCSGAFFVKNNRSYPTYRNTGNFHYKYTSYLHIHMVFIFIFVGLMSMILMVQLLSNDISLSYFLTNSLHLHRSHGKFLSHPFLFWSLLICHIHV